MRLDNCKKSIKLLEPGQKRQVVMDLSQQYPIAVVCEVLSYPRSQVYYQARSPCDETALKAAITALAGAHPTFGYRRITAMLKRQGHVVNHKRVARLMRELK